MSNRPRRSKPVRRTARAKGLTPAIAASDLVRIALVQEPHDAPAVSPVQVLADGTAEQLTRTESARTMTMLALIANGFARALDEETRRDILLQIEEVLVDETLVELEWQLAIDGQEP